MNAGPQEGELLPAVRPFPSHSAERLQEATVDELFDWLKTYGDLLPRVVLDECARRGEPMAQRLYDAICDHAAWKYDAPKATKTDDLEEDDEDEDEDGVEDSQMDHWAAHQAEEKWHLPFHAVHVLGLMDSDLAGAALVRAVSYNPEETHGTSLDEIQLAYWPALFRNKPPTVLARVRELLQDRTRRPLSRAHAVLILLEQAVRSGAAPLEQVLDELAAVAADQSEDRLFRSMIADCLLDFPRERYRQLLRSFVDLEGAFAPFTKRDVRDVYAEGSDVHSWEEFSDPWSFYDPEAVEERRREQQEASEAVAQPWFPSYQPQTLVRESPKVGRNDPCPCGSGKKYKKCCLDAHR